MALPGPTNVMMKEVQSEPNEQITILVYSHSLAS